MGRHRGTRRQRLRSEQPDGFLAESAAEEPAAVDARLARARRYRLRAEV
ncbi:hypothetical protein [Sorangium sp. So ce854]